MRAVWYERTGPAREVLQFGERPLAEPAPGEVRVKLAASGVNPADIYRRAGTNWANEFPLIIPNSDGAGVVEALGAGVDPALLGQRVWLYNAQRGRPFGTAAEFTCVPAECIHPLPAAIDFATGACLGIPAMTAHRCLFADGPVRGLRVLVSGGGGAVGNYAIQLARWGGAAWVGATASGGWKTADAEAAGTDAVFDYRAPDCAARILAASHGGVDRIVEVDVGGNVALWSEVIALNGSVIGYASRGGPMPAIPVSAVLMRKNVNLRGVVLNSAPAAARRQAMEEITAWLGGPARLHRIAATFPLAETAAAHEAVEAGTKRGTVVVLPQD